MKNRLKEYRLKRKVTVDDLCEALVIRQIKYKGINSSGKDEFIRKETRFSKDQITAVDNGIDDPSDLDILDSAAVFLKVPFHELLCIPIENYDADAKDFDEACHSMIVRFVMDEWYSLHNDPPDLRQVANWVNQVYEHTVKLDLNFQETRAYAWGIVRPDFDPNAVSTMENYLKLRD